MGGLLVQRGGAWAGCGPPSPLIAVPNVTAHPSTVSVPTTVLLYDGPLLCGFNGAIKGLSPRRKAGLYAITSSNTVNSGMRHRSDRSERTTSHCFFFFCFYCYCISVSVPTFVRVLLLLSSVTGHIDAALHTPSVPHYVSFPVTPS